MYVLNQINVIFFILEEVIIVFEISFSMDVHWHDWWLPVHTATADSLD